MDSSISYMQQQQQHAITKRKKVRCMIQNIKRIVTRREVPQSRCAYRSVSIMIFLIVSSILWTCLVKNAGWSEYSIRYLNNYLSLFNYIMTVIVRTILPSRGVQSVCFDVPNVAFLQLFIMSMHGFNHLRETFSFWPPLNGLFLLKRKLMWN